MTDNSVRVLFQQQVSLDSNSVSLLDLDSNMYKMQLLPQKYRLESVALTGT